LTPAIFACCVLLQSLTPEVIEHAQAGEEAARQGRLAVAIQEFRKVTELQPNSAASHARLGTAYLQNGEYAAAAAELDLASRLNPGLLDVHQALGAVLLMQGNAAEALPHLEKAQSPDLAGPAYLELGRLGAAIAALDAALAKQPNDPNLLYYFGRATASASKLSSDQLAKLNLDPARKSGAAASNESRTPQDLLSLQDALAKHPNDRDLLSAFRQAAAQASQKAFDQILQSSANSARSHQVLAERFFESGLLAEAEREYVESLGLWPNTPNVHLALGNVLAAEGKWSAAAAQFGMETALRPFSADAFYSLGSALLEQGQARAAVEKLAQADRLKPNTPKILLDLGRAAFAAQDAARAEASWIKLLGIDYESGLAASAYLGLAELYRQAGKSQQADREMAAYQQLKSQGVH